MRLGEGVLRSRSAASASLLAVATSVVLLSASPARAACEGADSGDPNVGSVTVCVQDDGSVSVMHTTHRGDPSDRKLIVLVGVDYTGICVHDGPNGDQCTPDPIGP
jgi:hypothetical protein